MNTLFAIIFLICTVLLLFTAPETFLSSLLDGGTKGATTCVSLIATYSVWLGLMRVWEESGVARGISRFLKPVASKLLKTDDSQALNAVCMNLSVNLLGISGAATPYGIKAAKLLDKTKNAEYSSAMFFILNASSLQLIPTSIIAVRVAMHSAAPANIILPSFLGTLFSTLVGVLLTKLFIRPDSENSTEPKTQKTALKIFKRKGAGI